MRWVILGKHWSQDEIDLLENKFGKTSVESIAHNLGRTKAAVISKAGQLGIVMKDNQEWFTVADFCDVADISRSTVEYWIKNCGFPAKKKKAAKKYRQINPLDFWKWAEKNKHRIYWPTFTQRIFGAEPEWVGKARKSSSKATQRRPWTKWEIEELKYLLNQNKYTYPEISERLNRSHGAIKRKIYDLELPWPIYINRKAVPEYTKEEISQSVTLYEQGWPLNKIAKKLGRTEMGLRGKLERSGYRINGKKLEEVRV